MAYRGGADYFAELMAEAIGKANAESGKAALGHMLDRLALEYPKKPIYLSVIPGNDAAIRLYRGAGFRFTGEKDVHGEDVMRLAYPERNS